MYVDVLSILFSTIIPMFSHHLVHLHMLQDVRICKCFTKPHLKCCKNLFFLALIALHFVFQEHLVVKP